MASNNISRTFPVVFKFKKTANLYLKMLLSYSDFNSCIS